MSANCRWWLRFACFLAVFFAAFSCWATPILYAGSGSEKVRVSHVVLSVDDDSSAVTILADYTGERRKFAAIVPVPADVEPSDLLRPDESVVQRITEITAPRFVEYWQQLSCDVSRATRESEKETVSSTSQLAPNQRQLESPPSQPTPADWSLAPFLSAHLFDRARLLTWLTQRKLRLADDAEVALRDAERANQRFLVLLVDGARLDFFDAESAMLPPIGYRTHRRLMRFPARFGLANSGRYHDLYLYVLGPGRAIADNYATFFAPTNLTVQGSIRTQMAEFYNGLFDAFQKQHPRGFLEEYAFPATECPEPCPVAPLSSRDLVELGSPALGPHSQPRVLSRLHYRHSKSQLPEDPLIAFTTPVRSELGSPQGPRATLDRTVKSGPENAYLSRFVHMHPYRGRESCVNEAPVRWGGPPLPEPKPHEAFLAVNMSRLARDRFDLDRVIVETDYEFSNARPNTSSPPPARAPSLGCSLQASNRAEHCMIWFFVLAFGVLWWNRARGSQDRVRTPP